MRFHQFKILLGGLAVLLAVLACSTVSPALPTIATFPPAPAGTATATRPLPATAAPTVPATTEYCHPGPADRRPQPADPAGRSLPIHPVPVYAGPQ